MSELSSGPVALPAPGWYQDPAGSTRWWSGQAWTEHVGAPAAPAAEPPAVEPPAAAAPIPVTQAPAPTYSGPVALGENRFGAPHPSAPTAQAWSPHAPGPDLKALRQKGFLLVLAGIAVLAIGVFSYFNAEANGGFIWIGGFIFGLSLLVRGGTLLAAVGKQT